MADPNTPFGPVAMGNSPARAAPVTQQQLNEASKAKIEAITTAARNALLIGYGQFQAGIHEGTLLGKSLRYGVTGIEVTKPSPLTGRSVMRVGAKSLGTQLLLPLPLGYTPPETYGLHPSFIEKVVGPIYGGEVLGTRAAPARVTAYEAYAEERRLAFKYSGPLAFRPDVIAATPTATLQSDLNFLSATVPQHRSTPELRQLLSNELAARGVPVLPQLGTGPTAIPSATSGPVVDALPAGFVTAEGSTQPQNFEPANAKARENADDAQGINRELVQIKYDP